MRKVHERLLVRVLLVLLMLVQLLRLHHQVGSKGHHVAHVHHRVHGGGTLLHGAKVTEGRDRQVDGAGRAGRGYDGRCLGALPLIPLAARSLVSDRVRPPTKNTSTMFTL